MVKSILKFKYLIIGLGLVLFMVDRLGKFIALQKLPESNVISDFLIYGYYPNSGIGFGISLPKTITIIFVSVVLAGLCPWFIKAWSADDKKKILGLTFIVVGAASNFIDRIVYGSVIDYLNLFETSIFNLADVLIIGGVAYIIYYLHKKKQPLYRNNQ